MLILTPLFEVRSLVRGRRLLLSLGEELRIGTTTIMHRAIIDSATSVAKIVFFVTVPNTYCILSDVFHAPLAFLCILPTL